MSLETIRDSFDPTAFMRVGNPRRSSFLSGVEGSLVFYYENPQGRAYLIRTQAPWAIEQIQRWARSDVDGRFGEISRRAVIARLRSDGVNLPDTEPASARLMGTALLGALFAGRGRVMWPNRVEWPDTHRAPLASGRSTYFGAFDILEGRSVPVESITTAPAPPPGAVAPPAPAVLPPPPAPGSPVPAATQPTSTPSTFLENRTAPSTTQAPTATGATGASPTAPGAAPPVYPAGQRPVAAAPPGYAYVPTTGGPTVLVPVVQTANLQPGQAPPPAPAGHLWTLSVTGQVVLVSLGQVGAAPQGGCPSDFVSGGAGCKPTATTQLPPAGVFTPPQPADPADLAPKGAAALLVDALKSGLASDDTKLSTTARAKAKMLEVEGFAHPELNRGGGSGRFLATAGLLAATGTLAAVGGYVGGRRDSSPAR